jgi:hypothetical protein
MDTTHLVLLFLAIGVIASRGRRHLINTWLQPGGHNGIFPEQPFQRLSIDLPPPVGEAVKTAETFER